MENLVFQVEDPETKVYKEFGRSDFHIEKDGWLITLNFEKLLRLMWKIRIAERKEKNNRVLAGIREE